MKKQTFENRDAYMKKMKDLEKELDTLEERFAFGKFDDEKLYRKYRIKKQSGINQVKEQLKESDFEIYNLESYIEKSIEISKNIHKYWQLGTLDEKRKIQKLVFPAGIA